MLSKLKIKFIQFVVWIVTPYIKYKIKKRNELLKI